MCGVMTYVLFLVGFGYKLRQKLKESLITKIGMYCQRTSIFLLFIAISCFLSPVFIKSMTPKNPISYFGSIMLLTYGYLILAYVPCTQIPIHQKDAIILVTTRRSPGISLAITVLSFHNSKYYSDIVGYVLVYGMIRDWLFMPYLMMLRKKRLGYYWYTKKTPIEDDSIVHVHKEDTIDQEI